MWVGGGAQVKNYRAVMGVKVTKPACLLARLLSSGGGCERRP